MRGDFLTFLAVILFSFFMAASSTAETRCVTSGAGYGSYELVPLQKIFDLMVSPSPQDRAALPQVIQEYLAQDLVFIPMPGIPLEYAWVPEKGIAHVYPPGSSRGFWVLKECLKDCR